MPPIVLGSGAGAGSFTASSRRRAGGDAWAQAGAADSHRTPGNLDSLRRQSQKALRDDPIAQSLVHRLCDAVVGDRVIFQCKSLDENFNRLAEAWMNNWMRSGCDHAAPAFNPDAGGLTEPPGRTMTQICRLSVKACPRDGDSALLLTEDGQVQCIEAERIRSPGPGTTLSATEAAKYGGAATIVWGVCYDAKGRTIGYTVSDWDLRFGGSSPQPTVRFVPASQMILLRNPAGDEPNLSRSEPSLTPIIPWLTMIKSYASFTGMAAIAGASFGLVWKTETPGTPGGGQTVSREFAPGSTDPTQPAAVEIGPGFQATLGPNESLQQVDPKHPTQNYSDYFITNLCVLAAQQGVPLPLWMLDLRQVNFASAKAAMILFHTYTVGVWREWLRTQLLIPIGRWRLAMAIRNGEIEGLDATTLPADWDQHDYLFKPMPSLEPLADAEAQAYRVKNNLSTFKEVAAELGKDPEQHILALAAERVRLAKLGLLPPLQPGEMNPNAPQPKPDQNQPDPNADPNAQ